MTDTFNWNTALQIMEDGGRVYRTDWGHRNEVYIDILPHMETLYIYIHHSYPDCAIQLYNLSYSSLKSNKWRKFP